MCWSLTVSAGMVVFGGASTILARQKSLPKAVWVSLGYFTLMEALQVAGYLVINQCGAFANQAITILSFLHVAFQPAFINWLALELIPPEIKQRIRVPVYVICALCTAFMLAQLAPIEAAGLCEIGECMCARTLCTRMGDWHLAWDIPYNGLGTWIEKLIGSWWGMPSYMLAVFLLPILYGSWRFPMFHLILGPVLANELTSDVNSVPAIWCLFSIGIVTFVFFPNFLNLFRVKRWFLWPRSWTTEPDDRKMMQRDPEALV